MKHSVGFRIGSAAAAVIGAVSVLLTLLCLCGRFFAADASGAFSFFASRSFCLAVCAADLVSLSVCLCLLLYCRSEDKKLRRLLQTEHQFLSGHREVRADVPGKGSCARLAAGFNEMADRIEASERMREDFMCNVSHDLKTPMTVINGYLTNILDGTIPRAEEEKYLGLIRGEVMRLSALVGPLLDISRIDSGDMEYQMTDFDICEAVRITLISFLDKMEQKSLEGGFECDRDSVFVHGDYDAISKVLYCLCDNAVKFTPPEGRMIIRVQPVGGNVRVSFYNEGEGIPYEDQPFVFDRFFKGDRSRGLEKDSFGLGLALCRKIMEDHHSSVMVTSTPGKDCEFSFLLPYVEKIRQIKSR